jgi:hypothetical protein
MRTLLTFLAAALITLPALLPSPALAAPHDLLPLNPASPNHARVFNNVRVGNSTPEPDTFKAGEEILNAAYAYLNPTSAVFNQTPYRDRLLLLLDHRLGLWNAGENLGDIGFAWQACHAYQLFNYHRPAELSADRRAAYEAAIDRHNAHVLAASPLVYDQGLVAQLWLNGDFRLAMAVYFGGLALGDAANLARAEKARATIDGLMARSVLPDGGARYVGFWGEVATYHEENIRCFIWWWRLTGSPSIKAALDSTLRYSVLSNEPAGYVEQSSNIPYKHMYNGLRNLRASLWKAYLYDDGYNYFYGRAAETTTSTEPLNAILYQPNRLTRTPPSDLGVFWDANLRGPRLRSPALGWILHGRDVQRGGPEGADWITAQGFQGRHCGKNTFAGAFTLGALANNTPLKGALDTALVEFKSAPGDETDFMRGNLHRYLTQDEHTSTITRRDFGTLSTRYRISSRRSANAALNWNTTATRWLGNQLWVGTSERLIGLLQITNDASDTVHGLDARLVFTGGRRGIIGSFLPLEHDTTTNTFSFGDLRTGVHFSSFTGPVLQQRIAISDPASTDDFSALVRLHDAQSGADAAVTYPSGTRRSILIDVHRADTSPATSVVNVLPDHASLAVFQFTESGRRIRIVHNLTASPRAYTGNFVGTVFAHASLHRSWNDSVTPIAFSGGTVTVVETIPPYGHLVAVVSSSDADHTAAFLTGDDIYGAAGSLHKLAEYSLGSAPGQSGVAASPVVSLVADAPAITFDRLRADVDYVVERSPDLATWTPLATNPGTLGQSVTVTDDPVASGDPRRFLRVRLVVRPP